MAKITRYSGDLKPFASNSTGLKRTVFGDITQADDIDSNITADFLLGWESIGDETNNFPTIQDFNAMGYTHGQLLAYLHQVGVPEWSGVQEYHSGSIVNLAGVLYICKTNSHVSATVPNLDATHWKAAAQANIDSIASLRLTAPGTSPVQALGYYTPGDGGGGPLRVWKTAPVGGLVDNGGSILAYNGAFGTVIAEGEGYWGFGSRPKSITPEMFGATAGVDVSAEFSAVEAASQALNLPISLSEIVYQVDNLSIGSIAIYANGATLQKSTSGDTTFLAFDGTRVIGSILFDYNNTPITGNCVTFNGNTTFDEITSINPGTFSLPHTPMGMTVIGGNFRAGKVSCVGYYAPFNISGAGIGVVEIDDYSSADWGYKGFRVGGISTTVKAIRIGRLSTVYTGAAEGTEGVLVDTSGENTLLSVDEFRIGELDVDGAEANCAKIENVDRLIIGTAILRNAGNAYAARNNLTASSKYVEIGHIDADWLIKIYAMYSNIGTILNTTTTDLLSQEYGVEYKDQYFTGPHSAVLGSLIMPLSPKINGFLRIDFARSQEFALDVGSIVSPDARPFNLQAYPANWSRKTASVQTLVGYTGSSWTGTTAGDAGVFFPNRTTLATTTDLDSATSQVNSYQKYKGKEIFNETSSRPVWAASSGATSTWRYADGTVAHLPI